MVSIGIKCDNIINYYVFVKLNIICIGFGVICDLRYLQWDFVYFIQEEKFCVFGSRVFKIIDFSQFSRNIMVIFNLRLGDYDDDL